MEYARSLRFVPIHDFCDSTATALHCTAPSPIYQITTFSKPGGFLRPFAPILLLLLPRGTKAHTRCASREMCGTRNVAHKMWGCFGVGRERERDSRSKNIETLLLHPPIPRSGKKRCSTGKFTSKKGISSSSLEHNRSNKRESDQTNAARFRRVVTMAMGRSFRHTNIHIIYISSLFHFMVRREISLARDLSLDLSRSR